MYAFPASRPKRRCAGMMKSKNSQSATDGESSPAYTRTERADIPLLNGSRAIFSRTSSTISARISLLRLISTT